MLVDMEKTPLAARLDGVTKSFGDVEAVRGICVELAKNGQVFALETGQETAAGLKHFIEDVAVDNLHVNFDPANMILYGNDKPIPALDVLAPWIDGVHFKDGTWPTVAGQLGTETPLGEGDVDIPASTAKLLVFTEAQGLPTAETVKQLQSLRQSNGEFADTDTSTGKPLSPNYANTLGQSFAIIGLVRAKQPDATAADFLAKQQCSDGGFGYWAGSCQTGSAYLTAYVLHVMRATASSGPAADDPMVRGALDFLDASLKQAAPPGQPQWLRLRGHDHDRTPGPADQLTGEICRICYICYSFMRLSIKHRRPIWFDTRPAAWVPAPRRRALQLRTRSRPTARALLLRPAAPCRP